MFKKIMLLGAALAAMVAFAAPAAQANWTHSGEELEGNPTITLTGSAAFNTEQAGAHGNISAKLQLTGGTNTATVSDFTVTNCTGTGVLNNRPCTATPVGTWLAHANPLTGKITITNIVLINDYYLDAGHTIQIASTTLTGNVVATVNNKKEISSVTSLEGEGTEAGGLPATVSGSLTVSAPNAGTYGFE